MFCSKCGKQAEGEFCWSCGAKLYVPQQNNAASQADNTPTVNAPVKTQETPTAAPKALVSYMAFKATATYPIATGSFEIDSTHQIMRFMPARGDEGVYFHYQDIFDAELVQNGSSVFKTSTGSMVTRAIIGSVISEGFGIIAGATAKKNEQQYIDELYVRVMLKNPSNPVARIPFITGRTARNSQAASTAMENIETVLTQIKLAQATPPVETAYAQSGMSAAARSTVRRTPAVSSGNQNWRCPECDYNNRGTAMTCDNCGEPRPNVVHKNTPKPAPGVPAELPSSELYSNEDWFCPKCDLKNKATNKTCPNCGTVRPVEGQSDKKEKKGFMGLFKK